MFLPVFHCGVPLYRYEIMSGLVSDILVVKSFVSTRTFALRRDLTKPFLPYITPFSVSTKMLIENQVLCCTPMRKSRKEKLGI